MYRSLKKKCLGTVAQTAGNNHVRMCISSTAILFQIFSACARATLYVLRSS